MLVRSFFKQRKCIRCSFYSTKFDGEFPHSVCIQRKDLLVLAFVLDTNTISLVYAIEAGKGVEQ